MTYSFIHGLILPGLDESSGTPDGQYIPKNLRAFRGHVASRVRICHNTVCLKGKRCQEPFLGRPGFRIVIFNPNFPMAN